jgi:hypothetical protein
VAWLVFGGGGVRVWDGGFCGGGGSNWPQREGIWSRRRQEGLSDSGRITRLFWPSDLHVLTASVSGP